MSGVAEDAGEVVRHHAAQRVRVKGAQVQHALDAERFAAEAARDVRPLPAMTSYTPLPTVPRPSTAISIIGFFIPFSKQTPLPHRNADGPPVHEFCFERRPCGPSVYESVFTLA